VEEEKVINLKKAKSQQMKVKEYKYEKKKEKKETTSIDNMDYLND